MARDDIHGQTSGDALALELEPLARNTDHDTSPSANHLYQRGPDEEYGIEDSHDAPEESDADHGPPSTLRGVGGGHSRAKRSNRTRQDYELYTPDEERRVRRKLDVGLVGFIALLYMLSFLDRSNIGNASLAGLSASLHLTPSSFTLLLRAFYIPYILLQPLSLLYRIFPPHSLISLCVLSWGLIASLQSLCTSFPPLLLCRLALGVAEAAFGPGIPLYLSFFYRRDELAYRVGLFIAAAPLASSFAGALAWALVRLGDRVGVDGWRLLFVAEGLPSVLAAFWAAWWLPDRPGDVRWLTVRESWVAARRLRAGNGAAAKSTAQKRGVDWSEVRMALADPKAYLTAAMFFACNVAFSSMPVFEPLIVHEMGFSRSLSQLLSALPHLFAFPAVLLTSHLSDRLHTRSLPLALVSLASSAGYIILVLAPSLRLPIFLRYAALFPTTAGFFSAVTLVITWSMDNQGGESGKGAGLAVLGVLGQTGPLVGAGLYPATQAPGFVRGHALCAGFMAGVAGLALGLRVVLRWENSKEEKSVGGYEDGRRTFVL